MVETTTLTPIQDIKQNLTRMAPEFAKLLPKHVSPDKFVNVAITAIMNMPSLVDAERRSLYNACVQAATDGLVPDGREGAIVTFAGKAQWMPMIGGICKKVRNSGEIGDVDAQIVCANDNYDAWIDEKGRHFSFKKSKSDRGEEVCYFAYAVGRDGTFYFEEMTVEEMKAVEKVAIDKAKGKFTPWQGPFKGEMKRKTVLRRLAKYRVPQSTDLQRLTQTEDDIYQEPETDRTSEPGQPNRLKDLMGVPKTETSTATDADISFPDHGPKNDIPI